MIPGSSAVGAHPVGGLLHRTYIPPVISEGMICGTPGLAPALTGKALLSPALDGSAGLDPALTGNPTIHKCD